MTSANLLRVLLVVLALAALAVAVILQLSSEAAERAWEAFGGLILILTGQHLDKPTAP